MQPTTWAAAPHTRGSAAFHFARVLGIMRGMKRAFAIVIVVLLALGMIGMFFPVLFSGAY